MSSVVAASRARAIERPTPRSLSAALDQLEDALGDLRAVDLDNESGDGLGEALVRLTTLANVIAGVDARVLDRFGALGIWDVDGHRSPTGWLAAHTNASRRVLHSRTRVAQQARALPVMASALEQGAVTVRHLDVLADAHRLYPKLSPALREIEPVLTEYAETAPPEDLQRRLMTTLHRIDPDACDEHEQRRERREAGFRATALLDGWGKVDALLPPEVFASLLTLMDSAAAALRRERHDDADAGRSGAGVAPDPGAPELGGAEMGGAESPGLADVRSAARRRLDCFARVLVAARAATSDGRLPDLGGGRPVVTVVVPVSSAVAEPEGISSADADADATPAWLPRTGAVLSSRRVRRLLCDASVRRLLVDPSGIPLDIGRATRVISPAQRAAVEARDRWRCRFPGCRDPIDEIHHVVHWSSGGPTDMRNLAGLCWHHHSVVHRPGWRVHGDANSVLEFAGPARDAGRPSPAPGVGV